MARMLYWCRTGAVLCAAFAVAGCHADKHIAPTPTGNLALTVSSHDGTTPAVLVTGPDGYSKAFTTSQAVTALPLGSYVIKADSAVATDSVVGGMTDTATVVGSPAVLVPRDTVRASVTYALKYQRGAMWAGNLSGGLVDAIGSIDLRANGSPTPVDTLPNAGVSALALDTSENLWTVNSIHQIREYTVAQRMANGDTSAAVTLTDTAISAGYSMAFDSHGNLWIGDNGALRGYSPSQLTAGGAQAASITITSGALALTPGIAFDASGNLWVSNYFSNTLLMYTASQLGAGGVVDPTDTITSAAVQGPAGMQFDAHGNLWVANHAALSIVMFAPSQLASSGSPTPTVVLTTPSTSSSLMWGLAFDARGSLWVAAGGSDSILAFTAAQLAATGSPIPAVTLGAAAPGEISFPSGLVFDPWLPTGLTGTGMSRVRPRQARAARSTVVRRRYQLPNTPFFTRR